jgi:DNA-binding HxlR family transcriptional regulator
MPTHIRHGRSGCPVARSLDVLDDKWTLLIIREALSGTTCFSDFWRQIPGLAKTILSARLQRLGALGVFDTIPTSETGLYHEYVLTEMGQRLFSVVTALRQWGADYLFDASEPRPCLVDRRTGIPVPPVQVHSADGEPMAPKDTRIVVCERGSTSEPQRSFASPPARGPRSSPATLACRSSDIAHHQCDLRRQIGQHNGIGAVDDANSRYGLHQRSPSLWVFVWSDHPRPTTRQSSGGGPPPQTPRRPGQPPSPISG